MYRRDNAEVSERPLHTAAFHATLLSEQRSRRGIVLRQTVEGVATASPSAREARSKGDELDRTTRVTAVVWGILPLL